MSRPRCARPSRRRSCCLAIAKKCSATLLVRSTTVRTLPSGPVPRDARTSRRCSGRGARGPPVPGGGRSGRATGRRPVGAAGDDRSWRRSAHALRDRRPSADSTAETCRSAARAVSALPGGGTVRSGGRCPSAARRRGRGGPCVSGTFQNPQDQRGVLDIQQLAARSQEEMVVAYQVGDRFEPQSATVFAQLDGQPCATPSRLERKKRNAELRRRNRAWARDARR